MEKTLEQGASAVPGGKHLHGRGEDQKFVLKWLPPIETPPRTWRRPLKTHRNTGFQRNTSTDVEKTPMSRLLFSMLGKHLHGRGEDRIFDKLMFVIWETPPRTWRRRFLQILIPEPLGNTSTDVEKTESVPASTCIRWKHLHGRGEDRWQTWSTYASVETPPRTWRRLADQEENQPDHGNTSTDVEKTLQDLIPTRQNRKHLHGRGEDSSNRPGIGANWETPPRTWRRPAQ